MKLSQKDQLRSNTRSLFVGSLLFKGKIISTKADFEQWAEQHGLSTTKCAWHNGSAKTTKGAKIIYV